jgi:FAD/FMN-containing dehydrogenase
MGIVRCVMRPARPLDLASALQRDREARALRFERLPREVWPALAGTPARDPLARRIRAAFDPAGILNPGIFGEAGE